jgi:hypothetical protein
MYVRTGDRVYELVVVERAAVVDIRHAPAGLPGVDRLDDHALVVTTHAKYVVNDGVERAAARIWPEPEKCRECKRPL